MNNFSLLLGFLQDQSQGGGLLKDISVLWTIIIGLIMSVMALIVLLSKRRGEVHIVVQKAADANANLVKVRDTEINDLTKKYERLEVANEDLTEEYKALAQIDLKKLIEYWKSYEKHEAHVLELEGQGRIKDATIRSLEERLGQVQTNTRTGERSK